MHRRLILSGLLLGSLGIPPAVADEVSLLEVMGRARAEASEVVAAEARSAAGAARLTQAKAHRLPQLSLQEMWIHTDSPAEVFALKLNQQRFDFGSFVTSDPNRPDPIDSATTRLEMTLPLYTGGELTGRIRQAELAAGAAVDHASWSADRAALEAGRAYLMLAQAREWIAVLERSLSTVEAHVALARAYVDQGMIVASELLRAEVEQARIEDLLIEARGQAAVAEANLSFRMGVAQASTWELAALPEPPAIAADPTPWLDSARLRLDLEAARQMVAAARVEGRVERATRRPRLGLAARYDLVDDHPFGSHGNASAVMVMGSIDLFAGGSHRAAVAAADAEAEAGSRDLDQFEQGVELEVRQALSAARVARERYDTARAAVAAATEAERITEERFKQGVVKMIDLLDVATSRRETEARRLTARAQAQVAALELAVKAGRRPESLVPDAAGNLESPKP